MSLDQFFIPGAELAGFQMDHRATGEYRVILRCMRGVFYEVWVVGSLSN